MSFLKELFCYHNFALLEWGTVIIVDDSNTFCWHRHYLKISCKKCGLLREYDETFKGNPLGKEEAVSIIKKLQGFSRFKCEDKKVKEKNK